MNPTIHILHTKQTPSGLGDKTTRLKQLGTIVPLNPLIINHTQIVPFKNSMKTIKNYQHI
jgi:hypothetical protein